MANTAWGKVALSFVGATGNLTQLYPNFAAAGAVWPGTTATQIRIPTEGYLYSAQVTSDGTNGGEVELWDMSGIWGGIDVSSATTISNAQLVTLQNLGYATLMWRGPFTATSGAATPGNFGMAFSKGLAARFVGAAGSCYLNLVVGGGYRYQNGAG